LIARNWPCSSTCVLCDQEPETATHLCLQCPFAREVWDKIRTWTDALVAVPETDVTVEEWWSQSLRALPKSVRRLKAAILMYTAWNIWNERNRRIFEAKAAQPTQAFVMIKEEMAL
ncbi:hypothetical protein BAE44_0001160, partial [Dichanthelium oligosanthes]